METSLSALFPVPWFGEGTADHPDPSNRSISVWFACSAEPTLPTAHDSPAGTNAALESVPATRGAPAPRLNEPHTEASARLAPAPSTADGTPANASNAPTSPSTGRSPPLPPAPLHTARPSPTLRPHCRT